MTDAGNAPFAMPMPPPQPQGSAFSARPVPPRGGPGTLSCLMLVMLGGSLLGNVVLFFALLGSAAGQGQADGTIEKHVAGTDGADAKIAVVRIHGVIASGGGSALFGSTEDIVERAIRDLRRVRKDTAVKAVILDVNSPGGGITDCDRIHHEIAELRRARPEIKLVSLMRDVAASGGYYVSAPCDRILAHPTTITGSIGVIMSFMNLQGLFEKIGYQEVVIKSGEHKDIGSMGRAMTEKEQQMLQAMLMQMYDRFVQVVADGRHMDEKKVRELADGRIYTGQQAKENGLVDALGYFEDAVESAKSLAGLSEADVIEYQKPFTFQDLLRARADPPSPEAAVASEFIRVFGRRAGFYYLWTQEGAR